MKNMIVLFLTISFTSIGCEESENKQETSIYGTWKLIEVYSNPGYGNGQWLKVNEGYTYEILPNNSFNSTKHKECDNGNFRYTNTQITFEYKCDGFTTGIESPPGEFSYDYSFENGRLLLSPIFLSCIEGCGYRFTKIAEPQTEE